MHPDALKVTVITGGFDPIHSGHLSYIKAASELGQVLIVGVNSDEWLARKKGRSFMPLHERMAIVKSLKHVDDVIRFNDKDGSSKNAIRIVRQQYPNAKIIFANGGDRTQQNIPEMDIVDNNIEFVFGIGGSNKANSSSWILEEWKNPKTVRPWGWYRVLDDKPGYKVKELVIEPGKKFSMQKHSKRSEFWYILKGACTIVTEFNGDIIKVNKHVNETYEIHQNVWHQGQNNHDEYCHILEVQYGSECIEEDIERK